MIKIEIPGKRTRGRQWNDNIKEDMKKVGVREEEVENGDVLLQPLGGKAKKKKKTNACLCIFIFIRSSHNFCPNFIFFRIE